jgi:hypothetical protein
MHGGRGGITDRGGEIEEDMDKGKKEEAMNPIMMEEDQIKKIMETTGRTCNGVPYQYKMNNKKVAITYREGLESYEEEVEDVQDVEQIEEILCATYERKTGGPRERIEGRTPIHVSISVEPITPCVTNTPERKPPFRKPNFSGRNLAGGTSKQGTTIGGASSGSSSQISTPRRGISLSYFNMAGHDPTIRLLEFWGEAYEELENNLFICENIWEAKKIVDEDTTYALIYHTKSTMDWIGT